MKKSALALLMSGFLTFFGCGYHVGYTLQGGIKSLHVPIFKNRTLWREVEYPLTKKVIQKVQQKGEISIAFRSEDAEATLMGEVVGYQKTILSEGSQNQPLETAITLSVRIKLISRQTGEVMIDRTLQESRAFLTALGEGGNQARDQAFENLAEKILYNLEAWE